MFVGQAPPTTPPTHSKRARDLAECLPRREQVFDIRANIARLEDRARQLIDDPHPRVTRNLGSVFQTTATAKESVSKQRGTDNTLQAGVDVFLTNLGFNVQEQQRLLQQITTSRVATLDDAVAPASTEAPAVHGSSIQAFLEHQRSQAVARSVDEVHRALAEAERRESKDAFTRMWESRRQQIAEDFGVYTVTRSKDAMVPAIAAGSTVLAIEGPKGGSQLGATPGSSNPPFQVFTQFTNKLEQCAAVVASQSSETWLDAFTKIAMDEAGDRAATDPLAQLWITVQRILSPIVRNPSITRTPNSSPRRDSNVSGVVPTLLQSSRQVLERKYMFTILLRTEKPHTSELDALARMQAARYKAILEKSVQGQPGAPSKPRSPWTMAYLALRSGRPDTAALFDLPPNVSAALRGLATSMQATELRIDESLYALFAHEDTANNPFRALVLLILLRGQLDTEDNAFRTFNSGVDRIANTVDDRLWLRLMIIRPNTDVRSRLQSLAAFQEEVLSDYQRVIQWVGGSVLQAVQLYFHVLLPSTALRVLLEDSTTMVDGVHLALVCDTSGCFACSTTESPLDVDRLLQRYGTTLMVASRSPKAASGQPPVRALFYYFMRCNRIAPFVRLCQDSCVCARLFGRADGLSDDGELVRLGETPPIDLLNALELIADAAIADSNTTVAIHALCVLDRLSLSINDATRAQRALQRAVQAFIPALCQCTTPTSTSSRESLLVHAHALRSKLLSGRRQLLPTKDVDAFIALHTLVQFFIEAAKGEEEIALRTFFSLSFVPLAPEQVDEKLEIFHATLTDEVWLATMQGVVEVMRVLCALYARSRDSLERTKLQQHAHTLTQWQQRGKVRLSTEMSKQIAQYRRQLNLS